VAYPAENTQEGGTNTTTVSTANSGGASGNAFNTISGTPVFDNTAGQVEGTMGMKFAVGGTLAALYVGWDSTTLTTAPTTVYGRCYYWSSIHPGSSLRLIEFMNGATVLGYLGISNTVSKITWYNSANTAATATGSGFTLSTFYRIEFTFTVATTTTGSASAAFYPGGRGVHGHRAELRDARRQHRAVRQYGRELHDQLVLLGGRSAAQHDGQAGAADGDGGAARRAASTDGAGPQQPVARGVPDVRVAPRPVRAGGR
jgi:hypothetical protein